MAIALPKNDAIAQGWETSILQATSSCLTMSHCPSSRGSQSPYRSVSVVWPKHREKTSELVTQQGWLVCPTTGRSVSSNRWLDTWRTAKIYLFPIFFTFLSADWEMSPWQFAREGWGRHWMDLHGVFKMTKLYPLNQLVEVLFLKRFVGP